MNDSTLMNDSILIIDKADCTIFYLKDLIMSNSVSFDPAVSYAGVGDFNSYGNYDRIEVSF